MVLLGAGRNLSHDRPARPARQANRALLCLPPSASVRATSSILHSRRFLWQPRQDLLRCWHPCCFSCSRRTCASPALAQEKIIHRFAGGPTDGFFPIGNLITDKKGDFYGVTDSGGTFGEGTVFKLTRPAAANLGWRESVLYNFTGAADGGNPSGGLVFDNKGNLFGTAYNGGAEGFSGGVVFEHPQQLAEKAGPKPFYSTSAPAIQR